MGFGSWLADAGSDLLSGVGDAFGGDPGDSIGGFFDSAKEAFGGDLGGVLDQVGETFGGSGGGVGSGLFGAITDSPSGGGWSGALGNLIDQAGGEDAGGLISGFGSLFDGGGDAGGAFADLLPSGISEALAGAVDLPFVGDSFDAGSWRDVAGSLPGLSGALGSLGMGSDGIADHVAGLVTQAVGDSSVWSLGTALADGGPEFLGQIAELTEPGSAWGLVPGIAEQAGVELPEWAADLATDPTDPTAVDDLGPDDLGPDDLGLDDLGPDDLGPDDLGLDDFTEQTAPAPDVDDFPAEQEPAFDPEPSVPVPEPEPEPEPEPDLEPEPAPPPEPVSAEIESDFDAIGDDAFGDV